MTPGWWTERDEAELDLLVHELVDAAWLHRDRCPTCSAGGPWCDPMRAATEAVLHWRERRNVRSRVEWLARRDAA